MPCVRRDPRFPGTCEASLLESVAGFRDGADGVAGRAKVPCRLIATCLLAYARLFAFRARRIDYQQKERIDGVFSRPNSRCPSPTSS